MKKIISIFVALSLTLLSVQYASGALSNEVLGSVVQIYSMKFYDDSYLYMGSASGTIISEDGLILTNYHVVVDENGEPYDLFEICFTMSEFSAPVCDEYAFVLDYDDVFDLALLLPYYRYNSETDELEEIDYENNYIYSAATFSTVSYDDNDLPAIRDEISVIGYPGASLSSSITVTSGKVTGYASLEMEGGGSFVSSIETDAIINPGNSGGGAFDELDRFVGVPTYLSTSGIGGNYGYIVPVTIVNLWLDVLVDNGVLSYNPNQYAYGETQQTVEDIITQSLSEDSPGIATIEVGAEQLLFFDLDESNKNYDAIRYLKENKIINGYPDGNFRPNGDISRAELMKILSLATGIQIDSDQYNNCFSDVKDDWYARYVCYAKDQGWIDGYPDGTFKPANMVNKVEAIKMVLNTQGIVTLVSVSENPFSDVQKDQWYAPFVLTAKNLGILEETGLIFRPGSNATRAGISENVYRVIK